MNTRVLVTGAAGLLGSQILRYAPSGYVVDATIWHRSLAAESPGRSISIDLSDADETRRLLEENQYDLIINCAGASDVDRCETDHDYAFRRSGAVITSLLGATDRHCVRLFHISSDYVFDGIHGPYTETDEPNPISFYGSSKLEAERLIVDSGADACIIRVCSLYSVDPQAPKNIYRTLTEALSAGRSYHAATDLLANPTEVSDLAAAVWQLAASTELPKILHLAAPDYISRYEFALEAANAIGADRSLVVPETLAALNLPAKRPARAGLKSDLANSILGRRLRNYANMTNLG